MNILGIETCFGKCSICFFDGKTFHIKTEETKNLHRESLPKMLEEIISQQNFTIQNLNAIVVNHGPGTFTGIRIGIAFALGLSISSNIPLYGISTMEGVITQELLNTTGVAIKAIGNFCYYQQFNKNGIATKDPLYIEMENIPQTPHLLTNCEIMLENSSFVNLPNAQNLIERFLFIKPALFEKPLYLRNAI